MRQSDRTSVYDAALQRLEDDGLTYPCFCTRAEVMAAASAPHGSTARYPGTCRELSTRTRTGLESAGRKPVLRVRTEEEAISFSDRFHGPQVITTDDFVVRRADGTHAYHLATVIDDSYQGIGEVVRGNDLLDSTASQLWLIDRLDLQRPGYAHVPLVLGPGGARLAKRDGAVTLADRLALGETAEDVIGMLAASVGLWHAGEPTSARQILAAFNPDAFTPPPSGTLAI